MLGLVFALQVALGAAPPSVFGLQLGNEITMPECAKSLLGQTRYPATGTCYSPIADGGGFIRFALDEQPAMMTLDGAMTNLVDGKLEGISFKTYGVKAAELVYANLVQKYGQPDSVTRGTVQNRMGASFPTIAAVWDAKDAGVFVTFNSVTSSIDQGFVSVDTPIGVAARKAALVQGSDSGRKL